MWREFDEQVRIDERGARNRRRLRLLRVRLLPAGRADLASGNLDGGGLADVDHLGTSQPRQPIGVALSRVAVDWSRTPRSCWHRTGPKAEEKLEASPAGEALLARAGAIEASEPVESIAARGGCERGDANR